MHKAAQVCAVPAYVLAHPAPLHATSTTARFSSACQRCKCHDSPFGRHAVCSVELRSCPSSPARISHHDAELIGGASGGQRSAWQTQ
eukprot:11725234-Alexandrium_andersonii.AAC.1